MKLPPFILRGLILAALTGLTGLALAWASDATRDRIAENERQDLRKQLAAVVPASTTDQPLDQERRTVVTAAGSVDYFIGRKQGAVSALAFETSQGGYSGPIRLLVGVEPGGTILGVRVLSHTETPGLGDRIEVEKSSWIHIFDGKSLESPERARWKVQPDGGEFDALSGATITPRAVVLGVKRGLEHFEQARPRLLGAPEIEQRADAEAPLSPPTPREETRP